MTADDDTQLQLGILIGKVDEIGRRLDRSDESRKGLHGRMDAVASDLSDVKNDTQALTTAVESIRKDVSDMKPEIELVRGIQSKAWGAVVILGAIGAFLAWLVGNFWEPIMALLRKLGGH